MHIIKFLEEKILENSEAEILEGKYFMVPYRLKA
jgi:hypothetical protein